MAARSIVIERPQSVAVWQHEPPAYLSTPREDRLIAICIPVPRRARVTVHGTEPPADWPAPILNECSSRQ